MRGLAADHVRLGIVLAVVTIGIAPVAYMAMFTGFHAYDDEGYFLVLLRDYLGGRSLLTQSIPIYGPFFVETMGGIFKLLGVAPGHDSGRFVTLALWLLTGLLGAVTVYRLTRSLWLCVGAELVGFHPLVALTNEPTSPQALISLLLIGLVAAAIFRSTRPRLAATLIGGIVAALCLIKINVGVFAGLAVALAWAAGLPVRWRRIALPALVLGATILPFLVTSTLLSQAWVAEFAVGAAFSAAAVGVVAIASKQAPARFDDALWTAAGAVVVAVVCLGIAIGGGTSLADVWNGLIVVSLRFPRTFTTPLEANATFPIVATLSLGAAILAARSRIRLSVAVRVAVGLAVWTSLLLLPTSIFLIILPAAWVAAVAPEDAVGDPVGPYARVLVPALAVVNALQAYPVAGTQLSLAALPQLFVGALCLSDAARQARRLSPPIGLASKAIAAAAVLGVLSFGVDTFFTASAYVDAVPLGLPGAEAVRLPANQAWDLRATATAVSGNCSAFITYPGMNSFYVWTNQRPPTDLRSEIWMATYTDAQQQALVEQLRGMTRLCVVANPSVRRFWIGSQSVHGPLVVFIEQNFVAMGTFGDYQVLVERPG